MVIFFDIDNTLMDHDSAMLAATKAMYESANVAIPLDEFVSDWYDAHSRYYPRFLSREWTYEMVSRARVREVVSRDYSEREADDFFRRYIGLYEEKWSLLPDALPCLDRLASARLGIISNGRAAEQRKKLVVMKIFNRFEHVLVSEDCGYAKPSSEIFHLACELVGVPPAQVTYVGDKYDSDACAARNAGLCGVWLDRRGIASQNHEGPTIRSLDELSDLVTAN